MHKKNNSQAAFTITEMSIVMAIIALLIVGLLTGKAVIRSAEVKAVIIESRDMVVMAKLFKEKYENWPGDINNATSFWVGETDGDGDRTIESAEELPAWRHLMLADMASLANFTGALSGGKTKVGINVAPSKMAGAGYAYMYDGALIKNKLRLAIPAVDGVPSTAMVGAAIDSDMAFRIDYKMDDSIPDTGEVRGINGSGAPSNCISGSLYTKTQGAALCYIDFTFDIWAS